MSSVCRVCLAGNMRLKSLKNNLVLITVYERLLNIKFNSEDARPRALCCYCYQKLLRCYTFFQMAHRSEKIFNKIFLAGLEASQEYIAEANLEMKKNLSVSFIPSMIIDGKVEVEPIPSIDIKEEVTTEQNKMVEVESVHEDCIKSELTFNDDNYRGNDKEKVPSNNPVDQTKPNDSKMSLSCNYCNKTFVLKTKLFAHIRNSHSDLKGIKRTRYSCSKQNTSMNIDKIISNPIKTFACNVCDKQFSRKLTLDIQMRIHTGEKPFACSVCDKKFNQKGNLVEHNMRTHTGEKPFACNVCQKQFRQKGQLFKHKATHTVEKPFA